MKFYECTRLDIIQILPVAEPRIFLCLSNQTAQVFRL